MFLGLGRLKFFWSYQHISTIWVCLKMAQKCHGSPSFSHEMSYFLDTGYITIFRHTHIYRCPKSGYPQSSSMLHVHRILHHKPNKALFGGIHQVYLFLENIHILKVQSMFTMIFTLASCYLFELGHKKVLARKTNISEVSDHSPSI